MGVKDWKVHQFPWLPLVTLATIPRIRHFTICNSQSLVLDSTECDIQPQSRHSSKILSHFNGKNVCVGIWGFGGPGGLGVWGLQKSRWCRGPEDLEMQRVWNQWEFDVARRSWPWSWDKASVKATLGNSLRISVQFSYLQIPGVIGRHLPLLQEERVVLGDELQGDLIGRFLHA